MYFVLWFVGRHRCTQCDYTVDRQHILDYHVKNVHVAGISVPSSNNIDEQKIAMDHSDECQFQKDVASCSTGAGPPVKHRRTQAADSGEVMSAYRCISCGYSSHSVAAMARHRLCHSAWSLPHCCQQCSHRATTRRLLTTHIKKHDSQSTGSDLQLPAGHQHACSHCPYKSSSASHVATHERFHGIRRQYRCPYCSYSVDCRRMLMHHRRLHARDCTTCRQLHCPVGDCPFRCHSRDQLTSHCRQHAVTGRRRLHTCHRCSFAVDSRNALLHHQYLHDQRH